jgi:hypothetical protein
MRRQEVTTKRMQCLTAMLKLEKIMRLDLRVCLMRCPSRGERTAREGEVKRPDAVDTNANGGQREDAASLSLVSFRTVRF